MRPFLAEMHLALAAADAVISRAGASSLAELSALRLPSVLIPLPTAQDNHQFHNADALSRRGAAILLPQSNADAGLLRTAVVSVLKDAPLRSAMQRALGEMDRPEAASVIAESILEHLRQPFTQAVRRRSPSRSPLSALRWIPFKEAA